WESRAPRRVVAASPMSVALAANADDLVFDHGSPIRMDLLQMASAIALNGDEVQAGQDNDAQQDQKGANPEAAPQMEKTLLFRIEGWTLTARACGLPLGDQ